jgi:hypothetical protein
MYDFLKETTYDNDDLLDGGLLDSILSGMSRSKEVDEEPDQTDLIEMVGDEVEVEEENPQQEEEVEDDEPEFDSEQEDISESELAIIEGFFADRRSGRKPNPRTNSAAPDYSGNTSLDWLNTKTDNVNISGINPNIAGYLNTLPEPIRKSLVATSGNDDSHAKGSKHYNNNAIDLRYNEEAWNYIQNDPNFKQFGLRTINPNHGTAKHIHLESMKYGGSPKYIIDESKLYYE